MMNRGTVLLLLVTGVLSAFSDDTGFLKEGWINKIRPDHPRMILTAEDIPRLREDANGRLKAEFEALKKDVDAVPDKPELILREELVDILPDGTIKPKKPDQYGHLLFVYDGSSQAIEAALVYLVTQDRKYLEKTRDYLLLFTKVLQKTAEIGVWADWQSNSRINAILAYDWICNDLTPEERKAICLPILDYISKSRTGGEFTFRRTPGGVSDGNYGENALQFFIGMAAYKDGINDPLAEKMLRNGTTLFVGMLDHRERISAGSGLLSSITPGYSFGPYPFATFFFFHIWHSATGEDVSERWMQMCDYPNWFDYSAIQIDPNGGQFLTWGIGDMPHTDNMNSIKLIYTHMAQVIHFYGKKHPEKAAACYEIIRRLNPEDRTFGGLYSFSHVIAVPYVFWPFVLSGFDAAKVETAQSSSPENSNRYFYNPSLGLLLMRSGKSNDDTFASFRFGSSQVIHQHYDELSFVIYKRGFLALDSGSRCNTAHHHCYTAQTVAHNTILIHEDKEPIAPFWKPWGFVDDGKTYYSEGGQSSVTNAKALALQSTEDFIYAAGDATKSYAASKCEEAVRQFVYIKPDLFVIYDRVTSVLPEQKKEILFHFQNRPEQTAKQTFRAENGGVLSIHTLLPEKATFNIEGGPGREFWASGRNWELPGGADWDKKYKTTGKWRLEVSDSGPQKKHSEFLNVLSASLPETPETITTDCRTDKNSATAILTAKDGTTWELTFNRTGEIGLHVRQTAPDGTIKLDRQLANDIEKYPESEYTKIRP